MCLATYIIFYKPDFVTKSKQGLSGYYVQTIKYHCQVYTFILAFAVSILIRDVIDNIVFQQWLLQFRLSV